ncbi:MAG: hypothetical protein DRJ03_26925 [Chloroflexi bacterium]|nr:MAG: hypothetical protein DRJ03_26925 [Chloroflexota bacterium]
METPHLEIIWTEYMQYRARLRGFDLGEIERIVRYTGERYVDTVTRRLIAIGRHKGDLVLIPYEAEAQMLTPITIHVTTRQQINLRLKMGRLAYE